MSKSKVSVIIPIFNGEDNLTSCLKSVFSQTLKEIEVICVDDGSTDNTVEMLKVWQKENANLIIKTQQNAGAGAARNLGLSVATGEYVAFMDADDWYPDASSLEVLYEKAKENHALVCGVLLVNVKMEL